MTNDTEQPDIAAIRQLLLAAFTPEELRRFCYDRPTFRPVVNRFGRPYRLDDMVDELIIYCDTGLLIPELLAELMQNNPRQYARFFTPEPPSVEGKAPQEDQPAKPATPVAQIARDWDIITRPSRLDLVRMPDGLQPHRLPFPEIRAIPSLVRIPAGEFQMGSVMDRDKHAEEDELPPHPVYVPEFYIGRYPVTNQQYKAFVHATGPRPGAKMLFRAQQNYPVTWITWDDAVAYCVWLSQQTGEPFRLPTEAEWEKAARGTDGRIYPWGDEPPDKRRCNYESRRNGRTTIGRYSPQGDSPYDCADMAGNVWEWCHSLYEPYPYQVDDGREDLKASGSRVLRGGSWQSDRGQVRCACRFRSAPDDRNGIVGFRVARGPLV